MKQSLLLIIVSNKRYITQSVHLRATC